MNDLISRRAAISTIGKVPTYDDGMVFEALSHAQRDVALLPPAQPERKRGKWIDYANSHCECSVCHTEWSYFQNEVECFEFCPNCGADMRGDKNG